MQVDGIEALGDRVAVEDVGWCQVGYDRVHSGVFENDGTVFCHDESDATVLGDALNAEKSRCG